ncbi:hypothetical protein B0F90DRAFT_1817333 [Multifurca ochricompacta]|uniref:Cytochrome b561 domain-containing protein n=1 Tax=Multifurca ochricompacta TaxID=376703 RepID=A0AAD4M4G0_9AGAM|nr:hypothetical protein B0F90DRAFT_1817333 [Multifurca ochricompacta]
MSDSPMVVMWPSHSRDSEDGSFVSVTLSQRKAPYEVMPTPDLNPPFVATLSLSNTSLISEHLQMAFTRPAPPDGMQNIIWAFSRTPPESSDENAHISIHHEFGWGRLNLTRTAVVEAPLPVSSPSPNTDTDTEISDPEGAGSGSSSDTEALNPQTGVSHEPDSDSTLPLVAASRGRNFATTLHAALCIAGFLLVIPSGALVVRYAKVTGNSKAFDLHRLLQFGVAGASIAGGMLAYLFMDVDGSGAAHKWWGGGLILLYGVQCAVGSWVSRIPAANRTRVYSALLAGLGTSITLLAFYDAWLGFDAVGDSTPVWWWGLLIGIPSLYVLGVVTIQRRFGTVEVATKGEYVALDTRPPNGEP